MGSWCVDDPKEVLKVHQSICIRPGARFIIIIIIIVAVISNPISNKTIIIQLMH